MTSDRYPTPALRRTALVPAILGAIVLLAGVALIGSDGFTVIRFAVSILALIVSVFVWQAKHWWWLAGLLPIAVVWNPILPITIEGQLGFGIHYVAAIVFIAAGVFTRVRNEEDRNAR